ncbi:MAG: lipoyl synthase [Candidatus Coatesbacteria bacterium]|nr:MAG: lipoyl synthase [Candidatus Coatesbacteria bacterium]
MTLKLHLPPWLRTTFRFTPEVRQTKRLLRDLGLHTVCEEARCPNIGECFSRGTATFMIMGNVCTRNCAFCGCQKGKPEDLDPVEPVNVARAARQLGLGHCVVTSVTRDDLPDKGASHFAQTIEAIRDLNPDTTIEVLTPDFGSNAEAIETVIEARPDVFNHNVETIPRLYSEVRPGADYDMSLGLLAMVKQVDPSIITKSGLMIGLSENIKEVETVLADLASAGVDALTIGQYMQPALGNVQVSKYYEPDVFEYLSERGRSLGIKHVLAGPLVRSSYRAAELLKRIRNDFP